MLPLRSVLELHLLFPPPACSSAECLTCLIGDVEGAGGGEAGGERREDGRAAAKRAEEAAPRNRDDGQREGPPQRHRHQGDQG